MKTDPAHPRSTLADVVRLLRDKVDPALNDLAMGNLVEFLSHVGSSAPRAVTPDGRLVLRWQDDYIADAIAPGASVLDLGCGNGDLLARLMNEKGVFGQGVEVQPDAVLECVRRGVPVFHTDLDAGLKGFADESFDVVVLEETLQTLHRPVAVLEEMLRVGNHGVVSFPNFAYWRVRLELASRGRMPVTEWLPHHWYDTPNIHLFTLQDFLVWADEAGVAVREGYSLVEGAVRPLDEADNLYAEEVLLFIERAG